MISDSPTTALSLADSPADDAEAEIAQTLLDAPLLAGMRRPVDQADERPLDCPRLAVAFLELGDVGCACCWVRSGRRRGCRGGFVRMGWRQRRKVRRCVG